MPHVSPQCKGRDPAEPTGRRLQSHQTNADVYRRIQCTMPPSPPAPPPVPCPSSCDAGAECGRCLQRLKPEECPKASHVEFELKPCDAADKGDFCEGDGECGTTQDLNNCRGSDSDDHGSWNDDPFWMKVKADVYRVVDCSFGDDADASGPSAAVPGPVITPGGLVGPAAVVPGGRSGGGVTFLVVLASVAGGVLIVVGLRRRRLWRLGGAPTLMPSTRVASGVAAGAAHLAAILPPSDTMRTPLASSAAPIGIAAADSSAQSVAIPASTVQSASSSC